MADETTPLLNENGLSDPYSDFCQLIGIPPSDKPNAHRHADSTTLYTRATRKRRAQNITYSFTAALSNTLLLSQVVLGATLTALGASESSHVLITIFGVLNTIIAGLVAYLKSRGQPMRARMFRDDLEHVVDEIENSKTMWLGIKEHVHGYNEIDVDDKVSVRSEVARLTRLYESAVKKYIQNNPDMYSMGGGLLDPITGLRARPTAGAQLPAAVTAPAAPATSTPAPAPVAAPGPVEDEDASPATAKDAVKEDKNKAESPAASKDTAKPGPSNEASSSPVKDGGEPNGKDKGSAGKANDEADTHAGATSTSKDNKVDSTTNAPIGGKAADADAEPASAANPSKKDG